MVAKRVSAREAKHGFDELVGAVRGGGEPVIVEEDGRAWAVLIGPEEYEAYRAAQRERFFGMVAEIHGRNRDADPELVLADATTEVEAVRRERDAE